MDRRTPTEAVATNVAQAMQAQGISAAILSEATGIHDATLRDRLDAKSPFTLGELAEAGGFLHVPVSHLVGGR